MPAAYSADNHSLFYPERDLTLLSNAGWPNEIALAAELSRLAYLRAETNTGEKEKLARILKVAGFGTPELLNNVAHDAYGFASCNDSGLCVLAFRGTQIDRYQDFMTNIQVSLTPIPKAMSRGQAHAGFLKSAQAMLPPVRYWLNKMTAKRTRLVVCGHSLGGAIANLLGAYIRPDSLITFGCPRVGDDEFGDFLLNQAHLQITRVVNCCDGVPTVPQTFMGWYEHYVRNQLPPPKGCYYTPHTYQIKTEFKGDPED
ncbi:lipase family protein [Citrobacter sp. Res13-Sevr-PEB04-36]|uniref:lipase family protein n=1 Tax=Citrobacter sp. Res13-Sevr-PEB04-36 TaxID=2777960 RepID=UPI0018ACC4A1|nr:lipase family protein [Citrobacter sp. Res13-Sevr-PEB04-36]